METPLAVLLIINAMIVTIFIVALVFIGISQCCCCKRIKHNKIKHQNQDDVNDKAKNENPDKPMKQVNCNETSMITDALKARLNSLLTVKSLVTLILTEVFAYLALENYQNDMQQFLTIYTVIIAFYFGTQAQKNQNAAKGVKEQAPEDPYGQKQA